MLCGFTKNLICGAFLLLPLAPGAIQPAVATDYIFDDCLKSLPGARGGFFGDLLPAVELETENDDGAEQADIPDVPDNVTVAGVRLCDFSISGGFGGILDTGKSDLDFSNQYFVLHDNKQFVFDVNAEISFALSEATRLLIRAQYSHYSLETSSVANRPTGVSAPAAGDARVDFLGFGAGLKTHLGPGYLGGVIVFGNARTEITLPGFNVSDNALALHLEGFYQMPITDNISIIPALMWLTAPDGSGNPGMPDIFSGIVRAKLTW